MKTPNTATDRIARLLERKQTLTRAKAYDMFKIFHLGDVVHRLRTKRGMNIITLEEKLPSGKVIAKYKLAKS